MPATLTYPGVYIEEIPSGVRTITGVATSITAFIGRAPRGATNDPTTINSFGDFERQFGGLDVDHPMSYAVRDFYVNNGAQAIIARLYKAPADSDSDGRARFTVAGLKLVAESPGGWGRKLRVAIDWQVSSEMRAKLGLSADDPLFHITIRDSKPGGATENFLNVTVTNNARRIDRVLAAESNLVGWDGDWATVKPDTAALKTALKDAADKWKTLQDALSATPPVQATIDAARAAYEATLQALKDSASQADDKLAAALVARPQVPQDIADAEKAVADAETAMKAVDSGALGDADYEGKIDDKTGIFALDKADLFNLLCIPPDTRSGDTTAAVYQSAMTYCQARRAMLIVDSPSAWSANKETAAANAKKGLPDLGLTGEAARNAALYFPRVVEPDPLRDGQIDVFVPCGIIAGIMARTDTNRGVWKAPAGLDASVNGVQALQVNLNDAENGMLNPLGINCLRFFPASGRVVWGSRTLRGADQLADEYKYVPVRRLALYIEESLYRGTQWVVFEPNDEPLWGQIRLNIGAFMQNLFRQGAFQGSTPREAYFVKCDKETTTQNDIDLGIVNIVVGFAPLKPAEFVVIKIQQIAGQIQT
jgi:phage tail sheath protein FI